MRHTRRHRAALIATAGVLALSGGVAVSSASATTSAVTASAVAPASSTYESITATDAPAKVRVGAVTQEVRLTVVTSSGVDAASVALEDRRGQTVATTTSRGQEAGRPTVQKAALQLQSARLTHWGQHSWDVRAWRTSDGSCILLERSAVVDVRAHSMLGLTAGRSGSTVTVKGSLRAYSTTAQRYASWSSRPVSVQRWDGAAWRQVAGITTDRNGNLTARVTVPAKSQLRLVTGDAPAIWGAVSGTVTA